ncbi:hypothetical protein EJB05_31727, partial [Eragrostis curvula]
MNMKILPARRGRSQDGSRNTMALTVSGNKPPGAGPLRRTGEAEERRPSSTGPSPKMQSGKEGGRLFGTQDHP